MERDFRLLAGPSASLLDDHIARGGGEGLRAAGTVEPDAVITAVEDSGLRGRGGAGFPTGTKWRTILEERADAEAVSVVVNAAEGEPSTFKDRCLLRHNPYLVLEGALIAARVVGAGELVIALKSSFATEAAKMETALGQLRDAGWLDGIDARVFRGPEEYLFGEETGLLASMAGHPPFPRLAPPYQQGIVVRGAVDDHPDVDDRLEEDETERAQPALVNNAETFAHVAQIVAKGPEWFREVGTDDTPGTILVTVAGDVRRHLVTEVAAGTPLSAVAELAGGPDDGRTLRAALPGVAHPLLPADRFDTPLSHDAMQAAGSGLGAAGFTFFDDTTDMVSVAQGVARFLAIESCGQCEPCKDDGLAITETLVEVGGNRADDFDRLALDDRLARIVEGARCALAEQHQQVVGSVLTHFEGDLQAHLHGDADPTEPLLIAPIKDLDASTGQFVLDQEHATKQPDWTFGDTWSGKYPAPATQRS